jgi:electron transfer flavoprotein alpha subunit
VARWTADAAPVALLVTSTDWGREVAARVAVALDAAIAAGVERVAVDRERRLHVEAPALAGQLLVTTRVDARPAVVSVRPGSLPPARPRADADATSRVATVTARSRVRLRSRTRDPSLPALDRAGAVVGVGLGVDVADYPRLVALLDGLRAELACTRPVVDRGWLPSGRQVGLTGRALTPNLYVALGVWGAFEHVVGVAGARTILAVHPARGAPVFDAADVGIVADWRDIIGPLAAAVAR